MKAPTAGKWAALRGPDGSVYIQAEIEPGGTFTLAHLKDGFGYSGRSEETDANAALMALAPDLLAAVRSMTPWLGRMIADGGHHACVMPLDAENALAQAESVLAKWREATT